MQPQGSGGNATRGLLCAVFFFLFATFQKPATISKGKVKALAMVAHGCHLRLWEAEAGAGGQLLELSGPQFPHLYQADDTIATLF